MSFRDLVRFVRTELNQNASITLDGDQLCAASRTPGLILNRQTGNEIVGKLTDIFAAYELTRVWKFSLETFLNLDNPDHRLYFLVGGRDLAEWGRARHFLQVRVKKDHDAQINPEIVIPHHH